MRVPLVAGNWKMNGDLETLVALSQAVATGAPDLDGIELAVFPPFVYLSQIAQALAGSTVAYGAQNVSDHANGALTGEISATMLKDLGCHYVLVGHSERRHLFGETNQLIAAKFKAAIDNGIKPILCVGETLEEREAGRTLAIVKEQCAVILNDQFELKQLSQAVIAYEPVWAIGTGKTAQPQQAQDVHAAIRQQLHEYDSELALQMRILYGGSVKPANAAELMKMPDIDGGLVGGASLNANQFLEIGKQCKS